jgi:hypothetical protein
VTPPPPTVLMPSQPPVPGAPEPPLPREQVIKGWCVFVLLLLVVAALIVAGVRAW